jgi:hypothetical protein
MSIQWDEFLRNEGVTNVVESITMGPETPYPDGSGRGESLALEVSFDHPGHGPCTLVEFFHVGKYGDDIWDLPDPHAAMVQYVRDKVVVWVATLELGTWEGFALAEA